MVYALWQLLQRTQAWKIEEDWEEEIVIVSVLHYHGRNGRPRYSPVW